jgi:hypothetical protein
LGKPEQERSSNPALLQGVDERDEFNSHEGIAGGMNREAALLADAEISAPPVFQTINPIRDFARRQPQTLG